MIAINAVYDGKTFKPLEPVSAPANSKVIITFLENIELVVHRHKTIRRDKYPLRGSLRQYVDPFAPIAAGDWEAAK